jgi:hypothetical protein
MRFKRLQSFYPHIFAFLAIMTLAFSMTGAASADSATKRVTFDRDVLIGGTKLSAGDYGLLVDGGQLTVKRGKRVVAQTAAHWEARDDTPSTTSVLYGDHNKVLEIRFAHEHAVLVVATP